MKSLLEDKGHFMSIASLGKFSIDITPLSDNPQIYKIDIGSEARKDVISMQTNVGENVDQFGARIRTMLKTLMNGEPKPISIEEVADKPRRGRPPHAPNNLPSTE